MAPLHPDTVDALNMLLEDERASVEIDSPKSPTFTAPWLSMKQFEGLMSRCKTPAA